MVKYALLVVGCAAALALATTARADVGTVTATRITGDVQALGGDQVPGGVLYNNTTSAGSYFPPPAQAVPVELGMAAIYGGTSHVNNFSFGYATSIPDDGTGPIEVIISFYGSLGGDDGPDTANGPIASFDIPGLPGATSQGNGYTVGPIDLTAQGFDFDWPSSTFAFDGTTTGNWVTFTFQQTGTGPIIASGETLLNAFWSGTDLNSPYESGSFFWQFNGGLPNAFYLQVGGVAE